MFTRLLLLTITLISYAAVAHESPGGHGAFRHLTFRGGTVHLHATWELGPRVTEESILKLEWKDGSTHTGTNPPGTFSVTPRMNEMNMNHGTAPVTIEAILSGDGKSVPGAYLVSQIYFTMADHWQVEIELKASDGQVETQFVDVWLGSGQRH